MSAWIWWISVGLLAIALLPLPYGYYLFLRLALCITAGLIAYWAFERKSEQIGLWTIVFGVIALLYNPIFRIHLTREIWSVLNVLTAAVYAGHWLFVARRTDID